MYNNERMNQNILVTGGTGYIATHTIVSLLNAGYDVTIVDNLINSSEASLEGVRAICGCSSDRIRFFKVDICDFETLESVFLQSSTFSACLHFAGLKAVGESMQKPLLYYQNNILGTIVLVKLLDKYNCHSIIFSSSATVYGDATVIDNYVHT